MLIKKNLKEIKKILAVAVAVAVAPSAYAIDASDFDPDSFDFESSAVFARVNDNEVIVYGTLDGDSPEGFNQYLVQNPNTKNITIGFVPGSNDDESTRLLLRTIIDRGIDTHVLYEADSGGVDLWLAGRLRTRESDSIVGVHSWGVEITLEQLEQAFADGGVNQETYDLIRAKPVDSDGKIRVGATGFPTRDPQHAEFIELLEESGVPNAASFYYYTINVAAMSDIHEMTNAEIERWNLVREQLFTSIPTTLMAVDMKQALSSVQGVGIGGVLQRLRSDDENQIKRTLQALNPAVSGISQTLFTEARGFQGLSDKRFISRNNANDQASNSNGQLWFDTSYKKDEQGGENLELAYQLNSSRVTLGYDYQLTDDALVGVMYGHTKTRLRYDNNGGANDMRGNYFGLYGELQRGSFFTEAGAFVGKSESNVKRNITVTTVKQKATSKVDSKSFSASMLVGYDIPLGDLIVTPVAGFLYSKASIGAFAETGSIVATSVKDLNLESYQTKLGLRLSYPVNSNWLPGILNVNSYWLHELDDDKKNYSARFVNSGNSFNVKGINSDQDTLLVGVSYEVDIGQDSSLAFNTEYDSANNANDVQYSLTANYAF